MYAELEYLVDWYRTHAGEVNRTLVLLFVGLPVIALLSYLVKRALSRRCPPQIVFLAGKTLSYGGTLMIGVMVLRELGFNLTALLGAAGIAGIAVGFAAQTSLSNVISGLFLLLEKPFQLNDLIKADGHTGVVHSMDLMAVYLRTFDNQLIRIPNEVLIKASVVNITRFPIRRMDLKVGVAYKEDASRVMQILRQVADHNPHCLDEPEPLVIFNGFGDSALEFTLGMWVVKADFLSLKNSILPEIKARFDAEGIEIPFPHLSLYAGEATAPFPVRVVGDDRREPDLPPQPPAA
jgi:small-conductance mechanosensitive channel